MTIDPTIARPDLDEILDLVEEILDDLEAAKEEVDDQQGPVAPASAVTLAALLDNVEDRSYDLLAAIDNELGSVLASTVASAMMTLPETAKNCATKARHASGETTELDPDLNYVRGEIEDVLDLLPSYRSLAGI